ncbi:MAG: hypothetical protein JST00_38315 [Deltaproteobacteria bacterium]|nr:hypothetical protein [Deltaproteobacteria bacterium]
MRGLHVLGGVTLLAATTASEAHAQSTYRLSPVGGRTTLVGGTGIVYGHDSASAFLNPATVVRVDSSRLAFSVNFYYLSIAHASSWYQPGAIDPRFGEVRRDSNTAVTAIDFDSLPGSLCVFLQINDIPFLSWSTKKELKERQARLGMCLASIHYDQFAFNAEDYQQATPVGLSRQAQNIRQTFRRLAVGPSYSMYVTNALAVGISTHFSRTSHRSLFGATATTYGNAAGPITSSYYSFSRGDSHELNATLGAFYRIGAHQTVGIALESASLHLWGSGGVNNHSQYAGAAESATSNFTAEGDFTANTPPRIALGTGVEHPWGTAELNVSWRPATQSAYKAEFQGRSFSIARDGTTTDIVRDANLQLRASGGVNIGAGGEVFLNPRLSLLGGVSLDSSIVPKGTLLRDPLNYHIARTHRVGLSFGVGSHGEGGDLLLGLEGSFGWGERLSPNVYQLPTRLDVVEHQTWGVLFVLAGSTSFRNIRRTVNEVTKAFEPSKEEKKDEKKDDEKK